MAVSQILRDRFYDGKSMEEETKCAPDSSSSGDEELLLLNVVVWIQNLCTHTPLHVRTHTHTHTHIHASMHMHTHTQTNTHTHIQTCTHACTHTNTHMQTHTHIHIQTQVKLKIIRQWHWFKPPSLFDLLSFDLFQFHPCWLGQACVLHLNRKGQFAMCMDMFVAQGQTHLIACSTNVSSTSQNNPASSWGFTVMSKSSSRDNMVPAMGDNLRKIQTGIIFYNLHQKTQIKILSKITLLVPLECIAQLTGESTWLL